MKIGIIGGTGGMGKGFALRWSLKHTILVGSRDAARAVTAATEYERVAKEIFKEKFQGSITGGDNATVAKSSDVLVLSIPYDNIDTVCSEILPMIKEDCVVISPIVSMVKTDIGFEFVPMKYGKLSSHKSVEAHMKKGELVSAFHVISEKKLCNPSLQLDYDIFVSGDDQDAVQTVNKLISEIDGLRSMYIGKGDLAYMAEIATPLLLNIMIKNKIKNPGIKIV